MNDHEEVRKKKFAQKKFINQKFVQVLFYPVYTKSRNVYSRLRTHMKNQYFGLEKTQDSRVKTLGPYICVYIYQSFNDVIHWIDTYSPPSP